MFNYIFFLILNLKFLTIKSVQNIVFNSNDLNRIEDYLYDPDLSEICYEYIYNIIKSCLYTSKISSNKPDYNIFYMKNYSDLKLNQVFLNKTGDTSNVENAEKKGLNSAILVSKFSSSIIFNSTIKTNGIGAHSIFSSGETSFVKIYNSSIITYQKNSKGLVSKSSSLIKADDVEIITTGENSAILFCDNAEITCLNSTLTTIGKKSPIIFSKGVVSIEQVIATALHSQIILIKNKNSVYVKDSKLFCGADGNTLSNIDYAGIFIYDSSFDFNQYTYNNFVAYNSSFTVLPGINYDDVYNKTSMFSVVNTNANITLLGKNNFTFGSKNFLNINNPYDDSKNYTGFYNTKVFLYLKEENIKGNIICGQYCNLNIFLTKNSTLKGSLIKKNEGEINLYIDSTSTFNLTNNSNINKLYYEENENINKKNFELNNYEKEQFNFSKIIFPNITSLNKIKEDVKCNKTTPINKENNDDSSSESTNIEKNINNNDNNNQNNAKYFNFKFLNLLFIILIEYI